MWSTGDGGEVDSHQQREEGGDVIDHIRHVLVLRRVARGHWGHGFLHQHASGAVASPHVLCANQRKNREAFIYGLLVNICIWETIKFTSAWKKITFMEIWFGNICIWETIKLISLITFTSVWKQITFMAFWLISASEKQSNSHPPEKILHLWIFLEKS